MARELGVGERSRGGWFWGFYRRLGKFDFWINRQNRNWCLECLLAFDLKSGLKM